ncbi:MAG TPA: EAL domain-containing protein [Acidobacteriaceae bacterium]|jgi:sensor c-di-GMP phosphodiesterase-like protein|nr:EAL domain-containing protein [Acidobacteriaceae bacterium]
MNRRKGIVLASVFGLVAVLAPILISLKLAWNEALADERRAGIGYGTEIVRRAEETASQFGDTIQRLNSDGLPACSPAEVDLMRQVDIGSAYIQMVGRISGDELKCTSLGTAAAIKVGQPTLITRHGVAEYMNFRVGREQRDRLTLLSRDGVAVAIDPKLTIDVPTEGKEVKLAMLVPPSEQHERFVESGRDFRSEWFNPIPPGSSASFIHDGQVVSQVRSKNLDVAAVSVVPVAYAYKHVTEFAKIFVPIGLLCGFCFGMAVMYVARAQSSIPSLIRSAARRNDFFVQYQPVIELSTRCCVGAEALVRWSREDIVISPGSFIPLAEESGAITLITKSVIKTVARDLPRFLEIDPDFRVAINLTATDLRSEATITGLKELLRDSGASAENVVIEATEHTFVQDSLTQAVISEIRRLGFHVAMDDFGTGYSSLSCIQKLHLDTLKVDKAFVEAIGTEGATSEVVSLIIEMAHSLHLDIVAEGVETEAQCGFLQARGVQFAQGWLFGRPQGIDQFCQDLQGTRHESGWINEFALDALV